MFLLKTCNIIPNFETVDINLHFEQTCVHIALLFTVIFWVIVAKRQQENISAITQAITPPVLSHLRG
jgi:hypothetical protein